MGASSLVVAGEMGALPAVSPSSSPTSVLSVAHAPTVAFYDGASENEKTPLLSLIKAGSSKLPPPAAAAAPARSINAGSKAAMKAAAAAAVDEAGVDGDTHAATTTSSPTAARLLPVAYGLANLFSVVAIVLANKVVLGTYKFSFVLTLTWIHTLVTAGGMATMAAARMFAPPASRPPLRAVLPTAAAYVAYIVTSNLSIKLNTVGFYQLSKIAITPVVVAIEAAVYPGRVPSARKLGAIAVLLVGVALTTITDSQVASNPAGVLVAAVAVLTAGLYQVWAGSKQKELGLDGNQLLHAVAGPSALLLGVLVPALEPLGLRGAAPGTVLGYDYTPAAVAWILLSATLGLAVTLSAFLFIGATSSLTYNVVGHLKTVAILGAGVAFFGDEIGGRKLAGLAATMAGVVWYSHLAMTEKKEAGAAVVVAAATVPAAGASDAPAPTSVAKA